MGYSEILTNISSESMFQIQSQKQRNTSNRSCEQTINTSKWNTRSLLKSLKRSRSTKLTRNQKLRCLKAIISSDRLKRIIRAWLKYSNTIRSRLQARLPLHTVARVRTSFTRRTTTSATTTAAYYESSQESNPKWAIQNIWEATSKALATPNLKMVSLRNNTK